MNHEAREDPRKVRSRTRLLDAATQLLAQGGPVAVTIDAVTGKSDVARATLYRHFDSSAELIAAAFGRLLGPVPAVPTEGSLRERLVALLVAQATMIDDVPMHLTTMCWLGMGPPLSGLPVSGLPRAGLADRSRPGKQELLGLRARIVEQYRVPFDQVLHTEEARERLGQVDFDLVVAQLLGPILFTKLATLTPLGPVQCARIVDDFLAGYSPA